MALTEGLREFAESPERYLETPAGSTVHRDDDTRRCVLWDKGWASVTAIRVGAGDAGALVDEVRSRVPGTCDTLWHLGPSSTPGDLFEALQGCGLAAPAYRPVEVRALALTAAPVADLAVEVRVVDTFEEFVAARESAWDAFGTPEARRREERPRLRQGYEEIERTGHPKVYAAHLDGRLAGSAVALPSPRGVLLGGGSVAPWARGRGVYRALVRARWEYAVAHGAPALVTHANPATSYPILMRLGFEEVGTIRRLEDPARVAA